MKNLVIFSAEELYELIHDNPVVDKNSDTIYMSTDCYENGGYKNLADLRMLFAEGIQGIVQVVLNDKNKIEFHISIAADDDLLESLKERYTILIS